VTGWLHCLWRLQSSLAVRRATALAHAERGARVLLGCGANSAAAAFRGSCHRFKTRAATPGIKSFFVLIALQGIFRNSASDPKHERLAEPRFIPR
jgi:hypothetical protein